MPKMLLGIILIGLFIALMLPVTPVSAQDPWPPTPTPTAEPFQSFAVAPASATAGPILPWDISAAIDNLGYQALKTAAEILWIPHAVLLTLSYFIHLASEKLTQGLLPLILKIATDYLKESGIFKALAEIAFLLVILGLIASFIEVRLVDLRKFLLYAVLASLVLSSGPAMMSRIEVTRRDAARALNERVFSQVLGSGDMGYGDLPAPAPWASFTLNDYDEPGYTARDAALSALLVGGGHEEMFGPLPQQFRSQYFEPISLITLTDPAARNAALNQANNGLTRLILAYPLSLVSVLEGLVELLFSVAGAFLMIALPFSLLFAFFLPTEGITLGLLRQYLNLLLNYFVVNVLIAIGLAGLVAAAARGSLLLAVGGSAMAWLFFAFGLNVAKQSAQGSFTALTGSVAGLLGVRDPVADALQGARQAAGVAVGLAGAGVAAAAGMPQLAPTALSLGIGGGTPGPADHLKTVARVGLGLMGGEMMQGTPIAGLATAASTIQSMGDGKGLLDNLAKLQGSDAVMVGMRAEAGDVAGIAIGLDRALERRERRADKAQKQETSKTPSYVPDVTSPWREPIDRGLRQQGEEWGTRIAQAIVQTLESYRGQGLSDTALIQKFTNPEGAPALDSAGSKAVFAQLDSQTRDTLLKTPEAKAAFVGLVGEAVMPKTTAAAPDLAVAIAAAVAGGATNGAEVVARQLGSNVQALGPAYGPINGIVHEARALGLSGDQTRFVLTTGLVPPGQENHPRIEQILALRDQLPASVSLTRTTLAAEKERTQ